MTPTMWPELPSRLQLPNQHEHVSQHHETHQPPTCNVVTRLSLELHASAYWTTPWQ